MTVDEMMTWMTWSKFHLVLNWRSLSVDSSSMTVPLEEKMYVL